MVARPRILLAEPDGFSARALETLRAAAEVTLDRVQPGALATAMRSFDAIWIRLAHRVVASDAANRGSCRVIACPVTGLDHIDLDACARSGLRIVSLKGEVEFLKDVRATAELTLGLALSLLRMLPAAVSSVTAGHWDRDAFRGRELYGKTVGIVGVGRLGSIVARYFRAFDTRVLGYDVRPDFPANVERVNELHALLRASDIVTLHVSQDASTVGLIDAPAFAAMRPGAVLINTSRGAIVDEGSLLRALTGGRLAGAALDVVSGEPKVDATHPLVRYAAANRNLIIVPHIGGNTYESFDKTEVFVAEKLLEALRL